MQTLINYFALLLTGLLLQAQNTVEVSITNFSNDKETVKVGFYNTEEDWLEREFKNDQSKITNKTAKFIFTDVPDGIYAVSCFHDEDDDGVFDMYLGMFPTENYASSNGATGMFDLLKWNDAKFELINTITKRIPIKF